MSIERVIIDEQRLTQVIKTVLATKDNKEFVFAGNYISPEVPYVDSLIKVGNELKNPDFASNALFLTTALIRGNNTRSFFNSRLVDPRNILENSWIFEPEKVLSKGKVLTEETCRKFFRPAGYCVNAIYNWFYNCQVIKNNGGSITRCFDNLDGDWKRIEKFVYLRNRAKTSEKIKAGSLLNYGQHLTYLAFQWLSYYGLYKFTNLKTIPVDFQLARISIQTDAIAINGNPNVDEIITRGLTPAFIKVCKENSFDPREVSQALWSFGNEGCNNKLHGECPLENLCVRYITSKKYQTSGRLSSKDEGRYE